jgi:sterol desaturase/sphingolipid hydroxylase (fatty acid hydroxylase superfamily)
VAADEEAVTGSRRHTWSLGESWREFWRHPSPWLIGTVLLGASIARGVVGGVGMVDLVVPLVMVASFPLVEWVVHVVVLHWKPQRVGGVTIDPLVSRKHREHHVDPRDLPLVFIPWQVLLQLLVVAIAVTVFAFDRTATGLTFLVALSAIGFVYEWMHYLIHSDYRPVTAAYRAVWRNHRLHHYKNENYWFTVTTTGTSDRLLGTYPDPSEVETSPTARNLHGDR